MTNETATRILMSNIVGYRILLLIKHPNIDPNLITSELNVEPDRTWRAGDLRETPAGNRLPGVRTETMWTYTFAYGNDRRFFVRVDELVDWLNKHQDFLLSVESGRGSTEIYVQLPGDANLGDAVSWKTLKKMTDLRVDLSIEVFPP